MAIQSNFPNLKPTLLLDFANTETLDPRVTFTRGTPATYYDGKTTVMAEQNTVLYSQDFSNAYWTKSAVNVSSGITAPDGTSTANTLTETTANNNHAMWTVSGPIVTTTNISSTFSIYAKAGTCSTFAIQIYRSGASFFIDFDLSTVASSVRGGNGTSSITAVGNGWYRCTATSSALGSNTWQFEAYMTSSYIGATSYVGTSRTLSLWGAQAETRSAATAYTPTTTQPITNYIPVLLSAGGNQARFDHNPTTGESLGLLVEEQRTNLASYSADLGNTSAWPPAGITTISNASIAPDGTLSAMRMVAATSSGDHDLYRYFNLSNSSYTLSIYAKYSGAHLALSAGISNPWAGCIFDLQNGVAKTPQGTGMTCTASIQSVGNGWYRCSITYTGTSSYGTYVIISSTNNVNATMGPYGFIAYPGDGWSGVQLWGCQLEAGAFPTSYIPTLASTVTRSPDNANITGANFTSWFQPQQGSLYIESSYPKSGTRSPFQIGSSISNRYGFYTPDQALNYYDGSVPFTTSFSSTSSKIACSLVNYDIAVSFNNSTASAIPSGRSLLNADKLTIGSADYGGEYICGTIRKIAYYPARLSNTQLQALTT